MDVISLRLYRLWLVINRVGLVMKKYLHVFISFLVPFTVAGILALVAFIACRVGYIANDCFEQYIPFFNAYYDVLTQGKSMFYSFAGSMGFDFYAVFSYYLVSPLNLLILPFGKENIAYVVNFLIILKIGLAGGTFSVFIKNRFPDLSKANVVLFSSIYALGGFVTGYMWNLMWMDGILMFPLVMYGLDILMRDENPKWYPYTIFLTILVMTSYFMGYMSCVFILMYFFTYNFKSFGDFMKKFLRIGISSLLAIGMSAVILLPILGSLSGSSISSESLPEFSFYGTYFESLKNLLLGVPAVGINFDRQLANVFCTTFVCVMALSYFTCGKIKLSSKIRYAVIIAIIIISFNLKPFSFVWHGFHEQNGIPNRFSYLLIFMLITMAAELIVKETEKTRKFGYIIGTSIYVVFCICTWIFNYDLMIPCVVSLSVAIVYNAVMTIVINDKIRGFLYKFLAFTELLSMFVLGIFDSSGTLMGDYGQYVQDFQVIKATAEPGFYREKLDETYNSKEREFESYMQYHLMDDFTLDKLAEYGEYMRNIGHLSVINEATMYGLNNLTMFNTFHNYSLTPLYKALGGYAGLNYCIYYGENAFTDMLMGVRYYYTKDLQINSSAYEYVKTVGQIDVYENKYTLSLGYAIPQDMADNVDFLDYSNIFDSMNSLCYDIIGSNFYSKKNMTYVNEEDKEDLCRVFTRTIESSGEFIFHVKGSQIKYVQAFVNDELVFEGDHERKTVDLGELKKGDEVKIEVNVYNNDKDDIKTIAATVIPGAAEKMYEVLSKDQMVITDFKEDHITGTVDISEDSPFLITIPYSEGWTVRVDGEETQPGLFAKSLIMLDLTKGLHTIELEYHTPGFFKGALISFGSLVLFLIALAITLIIAGIKRKRKYDEFSDVFGDADDVYSEFDLMDVLTYDEMQASRSKGSASQKQSKR